MKFMVLILALLSLPATAQVVVEANLGGEASPSMLTGNYEFAGGLKWEGAVRYQYGRWGPFAIIQATDYGQSSRHASVSVKTLSFGPGVMFELLRREGSVGKRLMLYTHVLLGRGDYKLSEDNGQKIASGKKDFSKATAGARFYLSFGHGLSFFVGPEVSYSTFEYSYPAGYGNDRSSPVHLNIGGAAGLAFQF